mgnify:CR=1 FL=1
MANNHLVLLDSNSNGYVCIDHIGHLLHCICIVTSSIMLTSLIQRQKKTNIKCLLNRIDLHGIDQLVNNKSNDHCNCKELMVEELLLNRFLLSKR